MVNSKWLSFALVFAPLIFEASAGPVVEITATLVPVKNRNIETFSQLELRQEVTIARSRGAEDLLVLSAVVESGKWATIRRGRDFWHPQTYSDAKVHKSSTDDGVYSISEGHQTHGKSTIILPNTPTEMTLTRLGAMIRVRPTVKNDGLIHIEGQFEDTVFEGLSSETIPISVKSKQLITGNRDTEIMSSRIDKPVFRQVSNTFSETLPYAPGTSENARRLREAARKYVYCIPLELGNTAFGAPGKIELPEEKKAGPGEVIRSTMMKATMVKDLLVWKQADSVAEIPREKGIIVLEIKKIDLPTPVPSTENRRIFITTQMAETEGGKIDYSPVMDKATADELVRNLSSQKGTDLLSSPSILLESGQGGRINVSREFIFPDAYQPPSILPETAPKDNFPAQPAVPTSFRKENIGVTLELNASVEPDDMIRLNIASVLREFEGFLDFGNPIMEIRSRLVQKDKPIIVSENRVNLPIFPIRQTNTEVLIPNGSSVVFTVIKDVQNKDHEQARLLKFRKARVEEVETPRHLYIVMRCEIKP